MKLHSRLEHSLVAQTHPVDVFFTLKEPGLVVVSRCMPIWNGPVTYYVCSFLPFWLRPMLDFLLYSYSFSTSPMDSYWTYFLITTRADFLHHHYSTFLLDSFWINCLTIYFCGCVCAQIRMCVTGKVTVCDHIEQLPCRNKIQIDPESNFFDHVIIINCCYYNENQFKEKFNLEHSISIIHFNSTSLYANFNKIRDCLQHYTMRFNIIAISESWLSHDKGADFELGGYNFDFVNRANKKGGGVALYVDRRLKYKIVESMTTAIDDICECITVEIDMGKMKNVIVSCVYRAPNSRIETFKDVFEAMVSNTEQKVAFLCRDYNIDFLNPNKSPAIDEFIDAMYSKGLYPSITKPSRITTHSATVIDNILTKNMINN